MTPQRVDRSDQGQGNVDEAIALATETAGRWADASTRHPVSRTAKLLADVLEDEGGLDFTVQFVDGVVRPEDTHVAAAHLARLGARGVPFLPAWLSVPTRAGAGWAVSPRGPWSGLHARCSNSWSATWSSTCQRTTSGTRSRACAPTARAST